MTRLRELSVIIIALFVVAGAFVFGARVSGRLAAPEPRYELLAHVARQPKESKPAPALQAKKAVAAKKPKARPTPAPSPVAVTPPPAPVAMPVEPSPPQPQPQPPPAPVAAVPPPVPAVSPQQPSATAPPPVAVTPPPAQPPSCQPGQININTAAASELEDIIHVGPATAAKIIAARPFASVDELEGKVKGIGPKYQADIVAEGKACAQ